MPEKPGDGDRKDAGQLFKSVFDPLFPMLITVSTEMGSPNATGNAVIVRG
jgi:hypothetical protein